MKLIVSHADTIFALQQSSSKNIQDNPNLSIDIKKLKQGDTLLACLAIFNEKGADGYRYDDFKKLYNFYVDIIRQNAIALEIVDKFADIEAIRAKGKTPIMMTNEDMGPFYGGLDQVQQMYDMGVRMSSFTWNFETTFGFPNSMIREINEKGLTQKGKNAVEIMNSLGMIIDISHLSDGGIKDVLEISKKPIIASHSNARAVCRHQRNCTDRQIKGIAEGGGFVAINFADMFLSQDNNPSIENMVRHIEHIIKIGGESCVAIGSDFDGIPRPAEIKTMAEMEKLAIVMEKEGYASTVIEKLFYKNALATFKEILK